MKLRIALHLIETNWSKRRLHDVSNSLARHNCLTEHMEKKGSRNGDKNTIVQLKLRDDGDERRMRGANHSGCGRLGRIDARPKCRESEQRSPLPKPGGGSGNPRVDGERRGKRDPEGWSGNLYRTGRVLGFDFG